MSLLELKEVTKQYQNNVEAVRSASFNGESGEFLVLVGPSGCGKSTLLRSIAGLEDITSGDIYLDGERINDFLPRQRDIGMVFQNYALYPHMTVFENIAFPLIIKKEKKKLINERVKDIASMLDLEEYLERKPKELSGGQRQRVALGRAIAKNPKIFLFDEPLSNLDAKLRVQMRTEILNLHKKLKAISIYVTHDQVEAMTMGDKIIVLNKGKIQQIAPAQEIYDNPANVFVASFIGSPQINLFYGSIKGDKFITNDKASVIHLKIMPKVQNGKEIILAVRPENLTVEPKVGEVGGFKAKIVNIERLGHESVVYFKSNGSLNCSRLNQDTTLMVAGEPEKGDEFLFVPNPDKILFFDSESGERIV